LALAVFFRIFAYIGLLVISTPKKAVIKKSSKNKSIASHPDIKIVQPSSPTNGNGDLNTHKGEGEPLK